MKTILLALCLGFGLSAGTAYSAVINFNGTLAEIGDDVTIGHKALIHACTIGDGVLVGMGAIIMDGATIGEGSVIGAGALVLAGSEAPAGSLVFGSPAKVVRELDQQERAEGRRLAKKYVRVSRKYLEKGLGVG